jgi:beta-fructofuranosidase
VRPILHFTAETGWINDPHAITYRNGTYHLFYQYVPGSRVWAPNCHWGHAVGWSLFELEQLPVALAPGDDDDGIWSGSLITDATGQSHIFYTSVKQHDFGVGRIRVATPEDDAWISWKKGPVVAFAPTDLDIVAFRDPFVFRDGDTWRMVVGAGRSNGTACVLSYVSKDLDSWRYEGIAAQRSTNETEPVWMGTLWEYPQIFKLDGRHVIVFSVWDDDVLYYAGYGIGTWADGHFTVETWGQLTFGSSYYAPSFFRDADGRPCLILWMRGVQDAEAGWSSVHSIPYVLSLQGDYLVATPHPDLNRYQGHEVDTGQTVSGLALDATWTPKGEASLLKVLSGSDCVFQATITADTLTASVNGETWTMPYSGGDVRMILDGPVAELSTVEGILGFAITPTGEQLTVDAGSSPITIQSLSR